MIEIRPIEDSDHAAIIAVADALPEWFDGDARGRAIPSDLRHQHGFVALLDGRIVGFITVFFAEGRINVGWLGVRPDQRRSGVGSRLLNLAEEFGRLRGVTEIATYTLGSGVDYEPYESTRQFYFGQGFTVYQTNTTDNPGCPEEIRIKKTIALPGVPVACPNANVGQGGMNVKPRCIIISGRPGSGKTTLAGELSRRLYLPKVSRDEIKEGYVNTFGVKHDQLPKDTNGIVNEVFFATILVLLGGNVSVVVEAAFQHKLWNLIVPRIQQIAHICIVICDLDAGTSARRHLERGLSDPNREHFHGDRRVSIFRETGQFAPGGPYDAPHFEVPTLRVSTLDGYSPAIERIMDFAGGIPNNAAGS